VVVTGPESFLDELMSSPVSASTALAPLELWTGGPVVKQKAAKPKKGVAKQPKATRCGQCYTCKNKHLKKVRSPSPPLGPRSAVFPSLP
jgi:hypothetical protein